MSIPSMTLFPGMEVIPDRGTGILPSQSIRALIEARVDHRIAAH